MDCCAKKHIEPDHEQCNNCGKTCDLEKTIYKIKHKDKVYCFDSLECKNEFQKKQFGEILY